MRQSRFTPVLSRRLYQSWDLSDTLLVYLFVHQKHQDGWTNLDQTFCGDSDYPGIEFRPKIFRLQPKRSEKTPFSLRCFTVLDNSAGEKKNRSHLISSKSSVFLVRFKTEIMSVLRKRPLGSEIRSPVQFGGRKKNQQISSHLNLLLWLGLFPVRFKTEIMSVLAKKNWKRSIFP